jgi:hypothetical protein
MPKFVGVSNGGHFCAIQETQGVALGLVVGIMENQRYLPIAPLGRSQLEANFLQESG